MGEVVEVAHVGSAGMEERLAALVTAGRARNPAVAGMVRAVTVWRDGGGVCRD